MLNGQITVPWPMVIWLFCAGLAVLDAETQFGLGPIGLIIWLVFLGGIIVFLLYMVAVVDGIS